MPNYFYTAKSMNGETLTGVLVAGDERELALDLKRSGVILITAVIENEKEKSKFNMSIPFLSRVSLTEKIMMVRNLEVMFSAGLSLIKSIDILIIQSKNEKMKNALADIKEKINKGENFSGALTNYPNIFSELFVNMIKIGEESGTLGDIFKILVLQFQKEHELKSKVKNAMVYPSIILMVMGVVGIIMVTFVIPSLKVFFATLSAEIPIYTKIFFYLSDIFLKYWYLFILATPLLIFLIFSIFKTEKGKITLDTVLLKLPIIAPIVKKSNSALLIRSLSSLMTSGVPLIRSLEISSKTVNNYYFKKAVIDASEKVKKGEKLSSSLKSDKNLFPFGVIEMMEVGEETGQTSVVLKKLADFYEQEAINSIERLTALIEPVLIIFLGVGVGFFAFSIIQPMYSSLQSIQ